MDMVGLQTGQINTLRIYICVLSILSRGKGSRRGEAALISTGVKEAEKPKKGKLRRKLRRIVINNNYWDTIPSMHMIEWCKLLVVQTFFVFEKRSVVVSGEVSKLYASVKPSKC